MSGNRINIADKSTLDAVKTKVDTIDTNVASAGSKLGDSTNTASNTPSTIFSGLKYLINNVIESANISTIMSRIGLNSDPPSSVPTSIFAGIKNIISNIDTVLSRQNTTSNKIDTLGSDMRTSLSTINSSLGKPTFGLPVNKIFFGTGIANNTVSSVVNINTPGTLYTAIANTSSPTNNPTEGYIKITINGVVIFWCNTGDASSNNYGIIYPPTQYMKPANYNGGYFTSFSSTLRTEGGILIVPVPIKFNTLSIEIYSYNSRNTSCSYMYTLD